MQSIVNPGHPADAAGRCALVRAEQKLVSPMTHLYTKFCLTGKTVFDFCMGTGSIAAASLFLPIQLNFFGCKAKDSCLSEPIDSILEVFAHQESNVDYKINET